MPKQGSKDLFHLIKALNKSEKAYFKKFAERHVIGGQNNYLKLFDAIDRQAVYDEKKLLRDEKYIKQLPYLKNYLMDIILKSMQSFYAEHTLEHRLRRMMDNAWILNKKGLYNACIDVLGKIKKESITSISGSSFSEASLLEQEVLNTKGDTSLFVECLEKTLPEQRELLSDLLLYNEITTCFLKIHLYAKQVGLRPNDEDKKNLKKEIEDPLLVLSEQVKSFRCKTKWHSALAIYYALIGNYEDYYLHNKKLVVLYRSNPEFIRENIVAYLSALNNYGTACMTRHNFTEALEILKEVWSIKPSQPGEEKRIYRVAVTLEVNTRKMSGDFEGAVSAFERYRDTLYKYLRDDNIQRYLNLYIFVIVASAYSGNYKQTLRLITDILSYPEITKLKALKKFLMVLQLIPLHELGHDISSFLKNTRRKIKAFEHYAVDIVIMNYLEKAAKTHSEKEKNELNLQTLKQLELLKDDFSFIYFSNYFDVLSWIQSKIEKVPLSEIIRNKLQKS